MSTSYAAEIDVIKALADLQSAPTFDLGAVFEDEAEQAENRNRREAKARILQPGRNNQAQNNNTRQGSDASNFDLVKAYLMAVQRRAALAQKFFEALNLADNPELTRKLLGDSTVQLALQNAGPAAMSQAARLKEEAEHNFAHDDERNNNNRTAAHRHLLMPKPAFG